MFLRKKESKNAPSKAQKPPQKKQEKVIFQKENPVKKDIVETKAVVLVEEKIETPKEEPKVEPKEKKPSKLHSYIHKLKKNPFKRKPKEVKPKEKTVSNNPFKKYETDLQLALVPLILLAILSILMLLNNHYLKVIADNSLPQVESVTSVQPFPLVENVIPPDISAKAAIILDSQSQVILLNKNSDLRFSMASTTKIMTALTALDYFQDDDILTIKTAGVEGSTIGLQPGEQLTFNDLLYAMLLPSANDAAVAIADNYPEGREAFIKKMNDKALLLHLNDTHFADPTGLNDDGNYTTVVDLARLSSYAMKNPKFAKVVGTQYKTVYNTYYSKEYALTNLNQLLGENGVNGVKTGTTEGAGEVLVTSLVAKDHTFIIVVMNSVNRFADTRELIRFVNEKVKYILPPSPK